jgi:hypothetical protein
MPVSKKRKGVKDKKSFVKFKGNFHSYTGYRYMPIEQYRKLLPLLQSKRISRNIMKYVK